MYIKKASIDEIPIISDIYAKSWKTAYRGMVSDLYLDKLKQDNWVQPLEKWMESVEFQAAILYLNDMPIGAAAYFLSKEEKYSGWGELQSLYILPEYLKMGYGKKLIEFVLQEFKMQGIENCYLWALRENINARAFYSHLGFKETSEILEVEIQGKILKDIRYIKHID